MTRVVLIRPGATPYDEQDRVQGVLDLPLSPRGRSEVVQLAERLAREALVGIYCGPGESVTRTAEAIAKASGLRPKRLDDLRNLDQGLWQGLQREEIRRRHGKVYRQWLDDPRTVCPPQGEPVEEALDRLKSVLKPILRRHRAETIGLVLAEPLARLAAAFLRRELSFQFDDEVPTGDFESIDLDPETLRNGTAPP